MGTVTQIAVFVLVGLASPWARAAGDPSRAWGELALEPRAAAFAPLRIELLTMGAGRELFSRFGHTALCVFQGDDVGRCYNFGTANFSDPHALGWSVVRGRARFWVSVDPYDRTLSYYRSAERNVTTQLLPLADVDARAFAAELADLATPARREYTYDHFQNNCATGPRDLIDRFTGGSLRRWGEAPHPETLRTLVRRGMSPAPELMAGLDFILGRTVDAPLSLYDAMFLPEVLSRGVDEALSAPADPVVVVPRPPAGDPREGLRLRTLFIGGLALALVLLRAFGRRRLAHVLGSGLLGGLGILLFALAAISASPEVRWNELLLVFLPTDLFLLSRPRYWIARAIWGFFVLGLWAIGVLHQPLLPALCVLAVGMWATALDFAKGSRLS